MNGRFIQSVAVDWEEIKERSYLRRIPALRRLERLEFVDNITFLVGENGSGKSTLLEAIAVAYGFNAEGGTINYRFSTYDDVSELGKALRLARGYRRPKTGYFFRAESFFNVASKAEEYQVSYGGRNLHHQSHGESFLTYFQSFTDTGLYLMDEPEAALSPQRQLALFLQIAQMAQKGSQFLIATHSPILLAIPGASILDFDGEEITRCHYEETGCYQVMDMFINHRGHLLEQLLAVGEEHR